MIDTTGINGGVDLVALVGRYTTLRQQGREWVGKCVNHSPDEHPSMYVAPEKGFIHCFACDFHEDAIGFLRHVEGLGFREAAERLAGVLAPPPVRTERVRRPDRVTGKPPVGEPEPNMELALLGRPVARWVYRDADGDPLGYVARYEPEGQRKEYRAWTWGARPGTPECWGCAQWSPPRPLYGLDRLAARPDAPVLVCEGEKAADAAGRLLPAYVVVTWPGGGHAWQRAGWEPLRGRRVLVWPDADEPGLQVGGRLAQMLADPAGFGCAVRLLDPGGQPDGWDAADALADGWTGERTLAWGRERTRAVEIPARAPEPADEPVPPCESQYEPPPDEYAGPPVAVVERRSGLPPVQVAAPAGKPNGAGGARPRSGKPHLSLVDGSAAPELATSPAPAELSDQALGSYFAEVYADRWRYVADLSSSDHQVWYRWEPGPGTPAGWYQDRVRAYFGDAGTVTRQALHWPEASALRPGERRALNSADRAGSLLQVARVDPRIVTVSDAWDADLWLLGVPGGIVDLRTGVERPATFADQVTRRCSVRPVAGEHPLFDRVLGRAADGDVRMLDYLWRWLGYLLTGATSEESFLFLHGQGGSGKSTLTEAVLNILGDYGATAPMETFAESGKDHHPEALARLRGARLVLTSETDESSRWNESRIKWLTGRNRVAARFMRGNTFEFSPQFKLLVEGNHRPGLKSVGEEMRRRLHLVEYAGSIPESERDKTLKEKLRGEYPAILASMVRGCLDWQAQGLRQPEPVAAAVAEYLEAEDTIGGWIDDCCERVTDARLSASAAYLSFRAWAESHGEYIPSAKRFSQRLVDRGIDRRRIAAGSVFCGLRIKQTAPAQRADWRDR